MTTTMRAALVTSFGQPLELTEVPIPTPKPDEVLVKVAACGVCHTDLHAAHGDWPVKPALPFIPGHEATGTVVAVGRDVDSSRVEDRIGVPWLHSACGQCEYCQTGWESLCPYQTNTGYSVNGGFAEYLVAPAAFATHIPDELGLAEAAPILCAGVTTYKGLKETDTQPGDWVVISGVGGLGHVAIEYAVAMGMRVAAVDIAQEKLDLALAVGAEIAVDGRSPQAIESVVAQTGGTHGALVTAVAPSAITQALGMLRRGGTCVLVGLPPGDLETRIFDVVLKRLTIRGSIVGTRHDLEEALAFAARGKVKASYETQPLEQINTIFDRMESGKINGRVVLEM